MPTLRSIRSRLVAWFLLIALAPLGAVLYASVRIADRAVEGNALSTLEAIGKAKAAQLEASVRERLRSVSSIASGLAFVGAAEELGATYRADGTRDEEAYRAAAARFGPRIDDFAKVCEFPRMLIVDAEGRVVYATSESPLLHRSLRDPTLASTGLAAAIERVRRERVAIISPAVMAKDEMRPSLEAVGPLLRGDRIAGFAAVTLDPAQLDAIVTDYTGLGQTGDVVGACRIDGDLVVATPSRTRPDAAFRERVPRGSDFASRLEKAAKGEASMGLGVDADGHEVLGAWVPVGGFGWGLAVTQHLEELYALAHAQQRVVTIAALASVVPIIAIAFFVARSIGRPIGLAARAARSVAEGDLSREVPSAGSGEPAAVLDSMRAAVHGLVGTLQRVRDAGRAVEETAAAIRSGARTQDEIVQQFSAASAQISSAVHEFTTNQKELNRAVQAAAGRVRTANDAAHDGRTALKELSHEIERLALGASSISARLMAVRSRAERIDAVVASVAKVANQTNLLSVNAAMEAERAGEAGAGFRAVAREIRRLSEQTADATLSIEAIVREMRDAVDAGVADMDSYGQTVQTGVGTVGSLRERLGELIDSVTSVAAEIELVAQGMQAQAKGVVQVESSADLLSDGARRTAATARSFAEASSVLESRSSELTREVESFRLP